MMGITQLQVHNLEGRIGTGLLKSDLNSEETQRFLGGRKGPVNNLVKDITDLIISRVRGLYVSPDGQTFSLYARQIDRDRSIEELAEEAKKAGWRVDHHIYSAGQIIFDGKPLRNGLQKEDLTISKFIGPFFPWREDIKKLQDEQLMSFDLAELIEFIPYRDELLKHDVNDIYALGSRFRGPHGKTDRGVARLRLEERVLELKPVKKEKSMPGNRHWWPCDWFGICKY